MCGSKEFKMGSPARFHFLIHSLYLLFFFLGGGAIILKFPAKNQLTDFFFSSQSKQQFEFYRNTHGNTNDKIKKIKEAMYFKTGREKWSRQQQIQFPHTSRVLLVVLTSQHNFKDLTYIVLYMPVVTIYSLIQTVKFTLPKM